MRNVLVLLIALSLIPAFASSAMAGASKAPAKDNLERAMFGMGCFWKTQYVFGKVPGVVKTTVGYSGGKTANPSYEDVCSHTTGHVEVAQVEFDPRKVSYKKLLEVFWSSHDPTTLNRQGPDLGDNYRSVVFYTSEKQKEEALQVKQELENAKRFKAPIVTAIEPAGKFYSAEGYHQNYYLKHGAACY